MTLKYVKRQTGVFDVFSNSTGHSGPQLLGTIYSDHSDTFYCPRNNHYYYRNYELGDIKQFCDKLILGEDPQAQAQA